MDLDRPLGPSPGDWGKAWFLAYSLRGSVSRLPMLLPARDFRLSVSCVEIVSPVQSPQQGTILGADRSILGPPASTPAESRSPFTLQDQQGTQA